MKRVINENEAACRVCFFCTGVEIKGGVAVCKRCGHNDLIDMQGNMFKPMFGPAPQLTARASKEAQKNQNHKRKKQPWPKENERRKSMQA